MIEIIPLYSGSDGNATVISSDGGNILIDCGGTCRSLETALSSANISPITIAGVFITHEHSDHISASEIFAKKYRIPIHITEPSSHQFKKDGYAASCAVIHPIIYETDAAGMTVRSFSLPHDSEANVGYRVTYGGISVGIATDMGTPDAAKAALAGCSTVMIEANHDGDMLKYGSYPAYLKARILSPRGHLSNADCAALACDLAKTGTKKVLLAHLSAENNTPGAALDAVGRNLSESGFAEAEVYVCKSRRDLQTKGCICLK